MTATVKYGGQDIQKKRDVVQAMKRGFMRRCPSCGQGALFSKYVKTVDECAVCGEEIHHYRADDFPAYLVILVVGHIVVPLYMALNMMADVPMWLNFAIWLPATAIACVLLLQPVKGAVVGMQWALRMHGFGDESDDPDDDPALHNAPRYSSGA